MLITTSTTTRVRDDDLQQHTEDDLKVNAIRNGHLIEVPWNKLTESERRAIYVTMFNPCGL